MSIILDNVIDCNSKWKAAMAGFGVSVIGLDRVFFDMLIPLGIPPEVHWALAGMSIDSYCKGGKLPSITFDNATNLMYTGAAGAAGGFAGKVAVAALMGR